MPFKSKAQQRFMFSAESRGELPKGTAEHWAHETKNIKKLPEKVHHKEAFVTGFAKTAIIDLPEQARYSAIVPMQDYVKGSNLDKETGQRRKVNARTQNVRGEDREFNQAIKHDGTSRRPANSGMD
jgi:hypothetical protein